MITANSLENLTSAHAFTYHCQSKKKKQQFGSAFPPSSKSCSNVPFSRTSIVFQAWSEENLEAVIPNIQPL